VEAGAGEWVVLFQGVAGGLDGFDARLLTVIPKLQEAPREVSELLKGGGLAEVRVGAEAEGVFDIAAIGRGAPDDSRDNAVIRMVVNPLQDIEAANAGHFEVKNQDVRKRMDDAVMERGIAAQIFDGFRSVVDNMNGTRKATFLKRALEEKCIVLIILGDQDYNP
jgi:hypothetical protein